MTDPSNQTCCFFCQRVLHPGEGRYRLLRKEKELECCPACFDSSKILSRPHDSAPFGEPASSEAEQGA